MQLSMHIENLPEIMNLVGLVIYVYIFVSKVPSLVTCFRWTTIIREFRKKHHTPATSVVEQQLVSLKDGAQGSLSSLTPIDFILMFTAISLHTSAALLAMIV